MTELAEGMHRLRALQPADADRVLAWRNADRVRSMMYTDHVISEPEHRRWLDHALQADRERHLIFETRGRPLGLVSFSQLRPEWCTAHWAFYVGEAEAPKGTGSIMEYAALSHAFGHLGLVKLSCEVIAFNQRVVRMHHRFGFEEEGFFRDEVLRDGRRWGIHRLALFAATWAQIEPQQRARLFGGSPADGSGTL